MVCLMACMDGKIRAMNPRTLGGAGVGNGEELDTG